VLLTYYVHGCFYEISDETDDAEYCLFASRFISVMMRVVHLMMLYTDWFLGRVRPSVQKRFFDFSEIWCVGRGRRMMHDGMQYDPIQGQGHEPPKVGNSTIFKRPFIMQAGK